MHTIKQKIALKQVVYILLSLNAIDAVSAAAFSDPADLQKLTRALQATQSRGVDPAELARALQVDKALKKELQGVLKSEVKIKKKAAREALQPENLAKSVISSIVTTPETELFLHTSEQTELGVVSEVITNSIASNAIARIKSCGRHSKELSACLDETLKQGLEFLGKGRLRTRDRARKSSDFQRHLSCIYTKLIFIALPTVVGQYCRSCTYNFDAAQGQLVFSVTSRDQASYQFSVPLAAAQDCNFPSIANALIKYLSFSHMRTPYPLDALLVLEHITPNAPAIFSAKQQETSRICARQAHALMFTTAVSLIPSQHWQLQGKSHERLFFYKIREAARQKNVQKRIVFQNHFGISSAPKVCFHKVVQPRSLEEEVLSDQSPQPFSLIASVAGTPERSRRASISETLPTLCPGPDSSRSRNTSSSEDTGSPPNMRLLQVPPAQFGTPTRSRNPSSSDDAGSPTNPLHNLLIPTQLGTRP